jgi:hypothetical protein
MRLATRLASVVFTLFVVLGLAATAAPGGQDASTASPTVVPPLIKFNGVMTALGTQNGTSDAAAAGLVTATFSLYEFQEGGTPLWSESQKVQLDEQGRYVVLLGAASPAGVPLDLFASGKALWLGVQPQWSGAGELPRVLLAPVPYALKASDSDTLGGKPASAYALAGAPTVVALVGGAALPSANPAQPGNDMTGKASAVQPLTTCSAVTSDGTAAANEIAKFTTSCNIEKSLLRDTGTAVAVGGTATPGALLDVQFTSTATSGTLLGERALTTLNPAGASSATTNGFFSNALTLSGNTQTFTGSIFASNSEMDHYGKGTLATGAGVYGTVFNRSTGTLTNAYGIYTGLSNSSTGKIANGYGVYVNAPTNAPGGTFTNYTGLYIANPSAVAGAYGLYSAGGKNYFAGNVGIGTATPTSLLSVSGSSTSALITVSNTGDGNAINATTSSTTALTGAISGTATGNASVAGVAGIYTGNVQGIGVYGEATTTEGQAGLFKNTAGGPGLKVENTAGNGSVLDVESSGTTSVVGTFQVDGNTSITGNLTVTGSISGHSKNFKIDDPIDPDNKFLYHASVESSEMMNMYTGNVTTDAHGDAVVELPAWFQALNRDFRYQLTVIGQFAQAIVSQEIENNRFTIKTDKANVKVSWQVTGVRHDAYAEAHPMQVEVDKPQTSQ